MQVNYAGQPVCGDVLKNALKDALADVDIHATMYRVVTAHLECNGVVLDGNHYYSLDEIESKLRQFLGKRISEIFLELVKKNIRKQYRLDAF